VRKQIWEWRPVWLTAPIVAGLVILLRLTGTLQFWEWMALDRFFLLRPLEPPDSRIVIVGISDQDIKSLGRWPIEDARLAELLERVKQQKPRAIDLDLYQDFPIKPGYQKLAKVFETTPNLIGIERKGGAKGDIPIGPPPVLAKQGQVSSNDILSDLDGKIRRGFLYWTSQETNEAIESLGLRLALIYLQAQGINPKQAAVSITDVMNSKIPAERFRDRIVLIGSVAENLKDFFLTPYSSASTLSLDKMAGVEIQATSTSHILNAALDGRQGIQGLVNSQSPICNPQSNCYSIPLLRDENLACRFTLSFT